MSAPYRTLAKNILVANRKRPAFPYKLTYAVTYRCNYRCRTCNIWRTRSDDEMSLAEIREFFRRAPHFSWIDLTGGEVFLRKDFLDVAEIVLSSCPNLLLLHFPTNGYLTDRIVAAVRTIMTWKPVKLIVTVSLDGNEEVNDEIRGVKGGWRRQMETYKQLHAIPGVEVVLGMTLSTHNANHMEAAFEAAKRECGWLEYRNFHVNIAHASGHYYRNADGNPREGIEETLVEEIGKYIRYRGFPLSPVEFLEREYLKRVETYLRTGKTPIRCHALRSSCFVDPAGILYPCSTYDRRLGSLRECDFDLSRIWGSKATLDLQEEIWRYKCPQCWTPCEAYQTILGSLLRRK